MIHRRQLTLESKGLEIVDRLQGDGEHHIEWRLHFSPLCTIKLQAENCLVTWDSGSATIDLDRKMNWDPTVQESGGIDQNNAGVLCGGEKGVCELCTRMF